MDSQQNSSTFSGWTLETLSCVQRLGIINCIPKSNKPNQYLKKMETTDIIKLCL